MARVMEETYGNPSSMHMPGVNAEKILTDSSRMIADTLRCKPSEILYTSGGTESDNAALMGVAHARRRAGRHLITTGIEHPAILETCAFLQKEGYEVSYLGTDSQGLISLDELEGMIRPDTILVSIMHTNNEIGSRQPVEEAGRLIKRINPECIFHVDAVQGYGKDLIIPKKLNVDLMSVSAHKLHGPRGTGFLYVKDKTRIDPIIYGGGQQKGMRSGTENVAGIYGMALAAGMAYEKLDEDVARLRGLRARFVDELERMDGVSVNGPRKEEAVAPHIISASFAGVRSEVLLHALEDKGIYVSSGSACASNRPHVSATLTAIGLAGDLLDSTIRFSTSTYTTAEEISQAVLALQELVPMLRRYSRH